MAKIIKSVDRITKLSILLTIGLILLTVVSAFTSGSLVASAKSPKDPYSAGGKLILNQSLNKPTPGWSVNPGPSSCQFIQGGYQSIAPDDGLSSCHYSLLQPSNLTIEARVRITKGDNEQSCAGFVLRDTPGSAYALLGCMSGSFEFIRVDNFQCQLLESGSAPAMLTELNQTNVMAAQVKGSALTFYINGKKVMSTNDTKYTQGEFGLLSYYDMATTFTNIRVWQL